MRETIKNIIANILYLDSTEEISDRVALFTELGLSSIDYIDLCFELHQQFNREIDQGWLWPLNKWALEKIYYEQQQWTEQGWEKICSLLRLSAASEKLPMQKLYNFFTVEYIERRLQELS